MTKHDVYTVEFMDHYGAWVQLGRLESLNRAEDTYLTLEFSGRPIRLLRYPAQSAELVRQGPEEV